MVMNMLDDRGSELTSDLVDLRSVPLSQLPKSGDVVGDALQRIVPDKSALQAPVPVAAFNSSI
jgi:hypothetical protein